MYFSGFYLLCSLLPTSLAVSAAPAWGTAASVQPGVPQPYFSWDVLPRAFHGSPTSRANPNASWSSDDYDILSTYQMVTIEKWMGCGAEQPKQASPSCWVERVMEEAFRSIKQRHPNVTTIMYLNSMFNFAFYHLNQRMLDAEAAGRKVLLRDRNGTVVSLWNDGNVYANITTVDWTVPEVVGL